MTNEIDETQFLSKLPKDEVVELKRALKKQPYFHYVDLVLL
jgi:hypothetical protein